MKKTLPLVAGLAGALFVSGVAQAAFVNITLQVKEDPNNPRLLICNLLINFDSPTDSLIALTGLIAPDPILFFRTNSINGFHQFIAPFGIGGKDTAVNQELLDNFPGFANDTYFNVGIKSGQQTTGGTPFMFDSTGDGVDDANAITEPVLSGTDDFIPGPPVAPQSGDYSPSIFGIGISVGWNDGGKIFQSVPTGGALVLEDLAAPITDQNIAGHTPRFGNSVFIAQLVIDINRDTNDGQDPGIFVQLGNVIWRDGAGDNFLEGFDPDTGLGDALTVSHIVPAPGTLALLGLAGLAGIRRRRR